MLKSLIGLPPAQRLQQARFNLASFTPQFGGRTDEILLRIAQDDLASAEHAVARAADPRGPVSRLIDRMIDSGQPVSFIDGEAGRMVQFNQGVGV